jgi:hypothetical protein
MALVYQHRRSDTNEVFYIGVGVGKKRAYQHTGRNRHWINVVNKTNYSVEILQEDLSWEEARQEEIKLINQHGRRDLGEGPLVNMTDGGDGTLGIIKTDEQRRSMSEKLKGRGLGRKLPPSTIEKLRAAKLGTKLSGEHNRNKANGLKNSDKSNAKAVQHIPSGTVYKGLTHAAAAFNIHPSTAKYRMEKGEFKYL